MKDLLLQIRSYLHGIWQYRWSAVFICWVLAIIGWGIVYSMPNQYSATAVVNIDTKSIMAPLLKGLAVESDIHEGLSIMSRVLMSRETLEEVVRETDLDLAAVSTGNVDNIISKLARSINLTEERGSGGSKKKGRGGNDIYKISYTNESPVLVYQVVSKLLNIMIENTLSGAREDTAQAQKFIDEQIAQYEARLSIAEDALAAFKRENVGLMPDERGGYYARLQREQEDLKTITSEMELAQSRLIQLRKQLAGESPLLDDETYGEPKLLKLKRYNEELQGLLSQFTEQHPDVQALRSIIADLKENGDAAVNLYSDKDTSDTVEFNPVYQDIKSEIVKITVDIEAFKLRLRNKSRSVQQLEKSVNVIPEVEAKLAKLNRDYDITRKRYLSMVERRESANLAQQVRLSGTDVSFRIIEPPRMPNKPSGPNRLLFLSAVLLAALGAGLGWGFLRYLLHPTFIDATQIRDTIGLPVLGTVGLHLTPEHKKTRKYQLVRFVFAIVLLVGVFGGAVLFKDIGVEMVNGIVAKQGQA